MPAVTDFLQATARSAEGICLCGEIALSGERILRIGTFCYKQLALGVCNGDFPSTAFSMTGSPYKDEDFGLAACSVFLKEVTTVALSF